ncbi:response regulator [Pseudoalteromonas luteoviolacea]|uniref:Response regulatory domain-containing protein n=1 Tax=Pseudoalteromonas luteoviolacea NCIMB 1942 TaxID=1365253 RepID=A0A167A2G1_9GAMM|nr:response regulator [Pseudoalteromonas luteoviolacea]KZN44917.1 hypothetical protein N482_02660 [Pseudoalteromonas luteoviolacea NCIMB 1942]KZX02201.1 hypothetical protein JL49_01375 [Pseudoalteromonas luteoviolacea]
MTTRVLVIDDDKTYRALLQQTFCEYDVSVACSGEEGIRIATQIKPHVILLDIIMEGIDGYATCSELRKIEHLSHTPIVFISNLSSSDCRLQAFEIGANEYVCKTTHPDQLKTKVVEILEADHDYFEAHADIDEKESLLLDLQRQNACMKSISLFMQATHFCSDFDALQRVFINTMTNLDMRAVVHFKGREQIGSASGNVAKLERELLLHHEDFERIHQFEHGPMVFNWSSSILLVKNVGELTDICAHVMDALELALSNLSRRADMVAQILTIEKTNKEILANLKDAKFKSSSKLKTQLFDSGLISQFDLQDENDLDELIASSSDNLVGLIEEFGDNAEKISAILGSLKKPPQELRFLFKEHAPKPDTTLF